MQNTSILDRYFIICVQRWYTTTYDEDGYQNGRETSHVQKDLFSSNNPKELDDIADNMGSNCDESYDVSIMFSETMNEYLDEQRQLRLMKNEVTQ